MVICQVIDKLKLVLLFAVQYLTGRVKMTVIFVSYYGSLAQAFSQLQIRHRDEICELRPLSLSVCVCVCVCVRAMRVG